jgi:hypothetical protein
LRGHRVCNADRLHGEIVKDKILWSNGTWWSRTKAKFDASEKAAAEIPSANFHATQD